MRFLDLLPAEHIVAPLVAGTVDDAIRALIEQLARSGAIADVRQVEQGLLGVLRREPVSVEPRVALPHLRTRAVDRLVVALGVAERPLTEASGAPTGTRIIAHILAPPDATTLYLQTVAALARLFRKESVVDRLSDARSAEAVLAVPQLASLEVHGKLTVRDIMVHNPVSVTPDASLREAVDIMVRHGVRALPVVAEQGVVLGIISEVDVMAALLPQSKTAAEQADDDGARVRDVMTRSVLCIAEDAGVEEAANMMINKNVDQFPVTSEGRLTGLLTRGDIIRKLFGR